MKWDEKRGQRGARVTLLGGTQSHLFELRLDEVAANRAMLERRGFYELALLVAFIHTKHAEWSYADLRSLFYGVDRARLRAAGDPLPGPGPFTVYRGVSDYEPGRQVHGISWTASLEVARDFAMRFEAPNPAVVCVTVEEPDVLAYVNAMEEQEFLVELPVTAEAECVHYC